MPVINLGQNRRYDAPRETSTATGSEMVTNAVAGLGETVAGVSSAIVDKITTQKAKVEVSKAERIFKTRFQELSQEALLEPGLDGAALAGRLEEAKLQAESEAGSVFQTGRGADVFESMREDMLGSAERHAADLVVKRTGEITVADTDAQTEALREEMATATPEEQARLRAQIFDLNDGLEPFIGVDEVERRRQALVQDTREIMAFTEVDTRLGLKDGRDPSQRDFEKGMKFAEGVKYEREMLDEDMTPDERVQLGNQLISYVGRLQGAGEGQMAYFRQLIRQQKKESPRGGRIIPEYKAALPEMMKFPELLPDLNEIQQIAGGTRFVDTHSVAESEAEIARLTAMKNPPLNVSLAREAMVARLKENQAAKPRFYSQEEAAELFGIGDADGTLLPPVDWDAPPEEKARQIAIAAMAAAGNDNVINRSGRRGAIRVLSAGQIGELSQQIESGDVAGAYQNLAMLHAGLSDSQYGDIVNQLPPNQRVHGYAGTLDASAAQTIARGVGIKKALGPLPQDTYKPLVDSKLSGAMRALSGENVGMVVEAVEAYIIGKVGNESTSWRDWSPDEAIVDEAIAAVANPVVEYKKSQFFSPYPEMSEDEFERKWEGLGRGAPVKFTQKELAGLNPSQIKEAIRASQSVAVEDVAGFGKPMDRAGRRLTVSDVVNNGRLVSIGPARYKVALGDDSDGFLMDAENPGKVWVLDFDKIEGFRGR